MSDPTASPAGGFAPAPRRRVSYLREIEIELLVAFLVILAVIGAWTWLNRPSSNAYPLVPHQTALAVNADGVRTLVVTTARDRDNGSSITFIADAGLPHRGWTIQVQSPDGARVCNPVGQMIDKYIREPGGPTVPRVTSQLGPTSDLGSGQSLYVTATKLDAPLYLKLCWARNGPVGLDNAYLSAQIPAIYVSPTTIGGFNEQVEPGPCVTSNSPRNSILLTSNLVPHSVNTSNFSIQSTPAPSQFSSTTWTWYSYVPIIDGTSNACAVNFDAVNAAILQGDTSRAFTGGILLGIGGIAIVGIVQQLLAPLSARRRGRRGSGPTVRPSPSSGD